MKQDQFMKNIKCIQMSSLSLCSKSSEVLEFAHNHENADVAKAADELRYVFLKAFDRAETLINLVNQQAEEKV